MERTILIFLMISIGVLIMIEPVNAEWYDPSPNPFLESLAPSFASDYYTPSEETHCIDGICTLTMYSGTMFAQNSSGVWVNASDVLKITRSEDYLTFHYDGIEGHYNVTFETGAIYNKNYYSFSQVKQLTGIQFDFPIEKRQTDWKYAVNISNISLNLSRIENITLTYKNHYGFTLDQLKSDKGKYMVKGLFNLIFDDLIDNDFEININTTERRIYISNITSDKFNGNSLYLDPTITLNETNGGNVGDARTDELASAVNTNYGSSTTSRIGGVSFIGKRHYSWFIWNLSVIPSGSTITNANLSVYVSVGFLAGDTNVLAYNTSLYNSTGNGPWVEGSLNAANCTGAGCDITRNITWANQPSIATLQDNVTFGTSQGWKYLNITNAALNTFSNTSNKNMSIVLLHTNSTYTDYCIIRTKEATTTSQRPQLVITYTAVADTTPPTYSLNSTNSTLAGTPVLHSLKWADETGLSGYIFSFDNCTGTLANDTFASFSGATNWSNVTKTVNSTLGCTIRWCVYANDTSNNWNATSCSTPFNYVTTAAPSVFSATFNIKTKELLNLPGRVILFGRFLNTNPKTNDTFSRMISAERTLNANEKTSNTFSALLVAGLQTFERFLNIGTNAADSFFYMITGIRFLNVPTKDATQFNRNVIVTKFLNVSTKDKINFLRNTIVEKFLNVSQRESNQFNRETIVSRLLNIQERMNVSWLGQLPYNIFERLLSIPLDLIDTFIVYVRVWEQPSIYQVCSILQQIGDSRAYLCIYATGDWKILIRGV